MNSELESKIHDRIKDLFGATWSNFALGFVGAMLSIWAFSAGVSAGQSDTSMQGPLSWWLQRVQDLGLAQPAWLVSVAAWRPPQSGDLVCWLLLTAASALSVRRSQISPGYLLVTWILLAGSCEWFGVSTTVLRFMLLSAVWAGFAAFVAMLQSFSTTSATGGGGYVFTAQSIVTGVLEGPVAAVVGPLLLPLALCSRLVQSYGYAPHSIDDPPSVDLLISVLHAVDQHTGPLSTLPASVHADLLAAVQLNQVDEPSRRQSVRVVRDRLRRRRVSIRPPLGR